MRKLTMILIMLAVVITGCGNTSSTGKAAEQAQPPKANAEQGVIVGKQIPTFTLKNLDGKPVEIGVINNKVTVINFWATWCPPCREEMPELNKFAAENSDKVIFVAVNIQEDKRKVGDFMQNNKYTMPVLLDEDGAVAKTFRVSAIPTTVIVDKDGIIKYRKSGTVTRSELETNIRGL